MRKEKGEERREKRRGGGRSRKGGDKKEQEKKRGRNSKHKLYSGNQISNFLTLMEGE